jgi:cystathionine gamma-synthase
MNNARRPETIAAADGIGQDVAFGALAPPLYLTSSYRFTGFENPGPYDYSRSCNPTRDQLASTLAKLEHGAGAVIVSSGMAAIDLVLSLLEPGDRVVAPHDCYGGTFRLLKLRAEKRQFEVTFVDLGNEGAVDAALAQRPKLLLIETPSNPLMRVVDISVLAAKAKAIGTKVAVDNTFLSPALQQPILLGADFVIHSTTKYLNGHSDVVGGAVVAAADADAAALSKWAGITGVTGSPFDAYQTLRGLRSLFPRIERQQRSAGLIASFLETHPSVEAVYYPGLASHPSRATAVKQQVGFGAMLSFEIVGGRDGVKHFAESVRIFTLAESLGGVESLVAHPATMTHAHMGTDARRAAGIRDNLLRLSIGLESEQDLIEDLTQALDRTSIS